jgi:putative endonuclease
MSLVEKLLGVTHPQAAHLALGARGEKLAEKFLRKHGYKILVRRYKGRHGEIDLACRHADTLAFVEVKTRSSEEFGQPSEAVNADKQHNLSRTALEYLREIGNPNIAFRFDIVEVIMVDPRRAADIRLIENAFTLSKPYYY